MGLSSLFKRKKDEKTSVSDRAQLSSPVHGQLIKLEDVKDPAFSAKMLGDGFAVKPDQSQEVLSPISGEITSIFDTNHAFGITSDEGLEVLVHIGVDTVNLKGKGFRGHKRQGQRVARGEAVVSIDLDYINANAPSSDVIVVITNMDKVDNLSILSETKVAADQMVADIRIKR